MYTLYNTPKNLKKLDELVICSNTITGGGFAFSVADALPLIVGGGDRPQVWLQARSGNPQNPFVSIVEASISRNPNIQVFEDPRSGVMQINIQNIPILQVKLSGINKAIISFLDLRPLGLNIWGNTNELSVAGSKFSKNTVKGVGVFVNMG